MGVSLKQEHTALIWEHTCRASLFSPVSPTVSAKQSQELDFVFVLGEKRLPEH